jgi:hypothetical protein
VQEERWLSSFQSLISNSGTHTKKLSLEMELQPSPKSEMLSIDPNQRIFIGQLFCVVFFFYSNQQQIFILFIA